MFQQVNSTILTRRVELPIGICRLYLYSTMLLLHTVRISIFSAAAKAHMHSRFCEALRIPASSKTLTVRLGGTLMRVRLHCFYMNPDISSHGAPRLDTCSYDESYEAGLKRPHERSHPATLLCVVSFPRLLAVLLFEGVWSSREAAFSLGHPSMLRSVFYRVDPPRNWTPLIK